MASKRTHTPEIWVSDHSKHIKTESEIEIKSAFTDSYCKSVKYILKIVKLLGRFTYQSTPDGDLRLKILSLDTLYCFIVYCILSVFAAHNMYYLIQGLLNEKHFDNVVLRSVLFLLLGFSHFQTLFSFLLEWSPLIAYINSMKRFQRHFEEQTGLLLPNFEREVKLAVIVSVPLVCVLTVIQGTVLIDTDIFSSQRPLFLPSYIVSLQHYLMVLLLWMFTNGQIRMMNQLLAGLLKKELEQKIGGPLRAAKLTTIRKLWLENAGMAQQLGVSTAATMSSNTTLTCIIFVSSSYMILTNLFRGHFSYNLIGFFVIVAICLIYLLVTCDCAHRTTQELKEKFTKLLLDPNYTLLDVETKEELNVFLQSIQMNSPCIKFAGFVTVNRGMFTAVVANVITYLVVLVQFRQANNNVSLNETFGSD